ncbi:hypothetical protein [Cetobacterium sp.]|uniref:hypothetical protein n=1 Tax=Cetobacterium sp. TaxID=2071632 RepID=UPI003F2C3249
MYDFDRYFRTQELVSRKVFQKFGERSIRFLDPNILVAAGKIRKHFGRPVIINNWHYNGYNQQRGLRANTDSLVYEKTINGILYLSPHLLGKGIDFEIIGLDHKEVAEEILKNSDKFEEIKRMENTALTPGYTHVDTLDFGYSKIQIFG